MPTKSVWPASCAGTAKLEAGEREDGLTAWRETLRLDPDNFIIRKQLWRADHPERFGETIDFAWQQRQLAEEKAREAGGDGKGGAVHAPAGGGLQSGGV